MSAPTAEQARLLAEAEQLVHAGKTGLAVMRLAALLHVVALRPRIEALIANCRRERDHRFLSAARKAPQTPDFSVVSAGSNTSVVVFCSFGEGEGFVRFVQDQLGFLGMNAIYVFDRSNLYYFDGFGGAGMGAAIRVLGDRLRYLGTHRLICFGLSSAGYGALRYGLELGADGILALSPRIILAPRGRIVRRIETALGRLYPADEVDLAVQFRSRPKTPRTHIVFGADNRKDLAMCAHLAAMPGVTLHPLPGVAGHNTLHELSQAGAFGPLFAEFLREVSFGWGRQPRRAPAGR